MSDLTAAQAKYEIDHPAFPRKELAETDGYSPKYSQVEAGELAFVSLVKWLNEHNQYIGQGTHRKLELSREDWQSLSAAEWRENDHP